MLQRFAVIIDLWPWRHGIIGSASPCFIYLSLSVLVITKMLILSLASASVGVGCQQLRCQLSILVHEAVFLAPIVLIWRKHHVMEDLGLSLLVGLLSGLHI